MMSTFFSSILYEFSVDVSCSRLFMSYFVGSFESLGVWQQLSRLSLLSCFSFFWCFHFRQLIITCYGKAVFSVSLHLYFVWFAIYSYFTCSLYFFICGWLFSMMYLICKCAVILPWITETVWWHLFMLPLWEISTGIYLSFDLLFCFQY